MDFLNGLSSVTPATVIATHGQLMFHSGNKQMFFEADIGISGKAVGVGTQGVQKILNFPTYFTLTRRVRQNSGGRALLSSYHCFLLPLCPW